jgi:RNA-directed DNA polymerase
MSNRRKSEAYPLVRLPLARLGRRRDLARLLGFKLSELERLVARRSNFYWRKSEIINGKQRDIACPFGRMRRIHERLAALLNRIEQPGWLSSPRRHMTVVKSAAKHMAGKRYVSLDVKKFYPSTTDEHIFQLFCHVFKMRDDVAGMLAKLATIDGRAPFGSPLSPILCAIAHRDMFDEIDRLCRVEGVQLSVWVDDVIISGEKINASLLFGIKGAIRKKGLHYHKVRRRSAKRGMVMTGVHVSRRGLSPSIRSHLKMKDGLIQIQSPGSDGDRLKSIASLIGQNVFMAHVYDQNDPRRLRLLSQRQWLHSKRRRLESDAGGNGQATSQTENCPEMSSVTSDDESPF